MKQCQPEILVAGDHFNIAQCTRCKRIGLYYNNLLVAFNHEEFEGFSQIFEYMNFDKRCVQFPGDRKHIIVDTCHPDIQFTFKRHEFEELKIALQQSLVIIQAQQILNIN